MRKNLSVRRLIFGFSILLLATVCANVGVAQNEEGTQQLYKFSYIQVKPGMALQFEEFIKSMLPTLQRLGAGGMDIWKTSNFGEMDKYLVVTPLPDAADMDRGLSDNPTNVPIGLVFVMETINRMVSGRHDFMIIPQPDFNIPPAEGYELKLGVNFTIGVAPGREKDFEKGLKEVLALAGKTNIKGVYVNKVGLGGNLDEYIVSVFHDSFVDMAKNNAAMEKELAAAGLTPQTGIVHYRHNEVLVKIPQLTIPAPEP